MKTITTLALLTLTLIAGSVVYINSYKSQNDIISQNKDFDCSSIYYDYAGRMRGGIGQWTIFRLNSIETQDQVNQCAQHLVNYELEMRGDMSKKILRTEFNIFFDKESSLDFSPIIEALVIRFSKKESPVTFYFDNLGQEINTLIKNEDLLIDRIILQFSGQGNRILKDFTFPKSVKSVTFYDDKNVTFENFIKACSNSQSIQNIEIYSDLPQLRDWNSQFENINAPDTLEQFSLLNYDRWVLGYGQSQMVAYRVERIYEQPNLENLSIYLSSVSTQLKTLELNIANIGLKDIEGLRQIFRNIQNLNIDLGINEDVYLSQPQQFAQTLRVLIKSLDKDQLKSLKINLLEIGADFNLIQSLADSIEYKKFDIKPILSLEKDTIDQIKGKVSDSVELVPYKPMF